MKNENDVKTGHIPDKCQTWYKNDLKRLQKKFLNLQKWLNVFFLFFQWSFTKCQSVLTENDSKKFSKVRIRITSSKTLLKFLKSPK